MELKVRVGVLLGEAKNEGRNILIREICPGARVYLSAYNYGYFRWLLCLNTVFFGHTNNPVKMILRILMSQRPSNFLEYSAFRWNGRLPGAKLDRCQTGRLQVS